MELYYNIIKNVYKTYTKRINSVYKFLIGMKCTNINDNKYSFRK